MEWVIEINEGNFNIIKELTLEEKTSINSASSLLNSFLKEINFFEEVNSSYGEYIRWFDEEKEVGSTKVSRLINNYLSSYKSFIDSWKTYIDRNKSEDIQNFYKKSIAEIYDDNFDYRFIYNLRNYAQHCDKPVSRISCSIYNKAKISLNCDRFLIEHKSMQTKFRKELETSDIIEFDIDETIRNVHGLLTEFQNKLVNKMLNSLDDDFLNASIKVLEFNNKYKTSGGKLGLIDVSAVQEIRKLSVEPGDMEFAIISIPYDLARKIVKSISFKFKFIGKNIGESNGFPTQHKPKLPIQMSHFETGNEFVKNKGIKWIRTIGSISCKNKDGYDRYFSVYVPMGLPISDYYEMEQIYKLEMDSFFSQ